MIIYLTRNFQNPKPLSMKLKVIVVSIIGLIMI